MTVVDTLALREEGDDSMDHFVARWRALLPRYGHIDLICGNALGGAVAQALLPDLAPTTAALLVSGPARTDALLESRLTDIADLAADGRSDYALALLDRRVRPYGHCPAAGTAAPAPHDPHAGSRLAEGMRLLCGTDVTAAVRAHSGPLLQIVGSHSQLVTQRHTAAAPHHRVHIIAGAACAPTSNAPQRCPPSSAPSCARRDSHEERRGPPRRRHRTGGHLCRPRRRGQAQPPLDLRFGDIGWECWREEGNPVPQRTWKLLEETDTCLLGAITSKPLREAEAELPPDCAEPASPSSPRSSSCASG